MEHCNLVYWYVRCTDKTGARCTSRAATSGRWGGGMDVHPRIAQCSGKGVSVGSNCFPLTARPGLARAALQRTSIIVAPVYRYDDEKAVHRYVP
jgi:hypothetical protein